MIQRVPCVAIHHAWARRVGAGLCACRLGGSPSAIPEAASAL